MSAFADGAWPWDPRVSLPPLSLAQRNSWMARPSLAMTDGSTRSLKAIKNWAAPRVLGMAWARGALPVVRKRRSGVARRFLFSTSHPRGTDAFVGHLNRGGSSAPATNRGDDLCCLRVFRCPMASLRTDRGEIVLITSGDSGRVDAPSQQRAPSVWHRCAPLKSWAGLSFAAARMRGANMLWSPRVRPASFSLPALGWSV